MSDETHAEETWVVDRVESGLVVLVEDEDGIVVEVAAELLGDLATEGAVLRIPLGSVGEPEWNRAVRDLEDEERRRQAAHEGIEDLRRRDPGGDVSL